MNDFEVTFLGTTGSCAFNDRKRLKYGTNTPCVAVKAGRETLIFDSGSGICGFHNLESYQSEKIIMFFSHRHIDHFNGLLFFDQFFDPGKNIEIYGYNGDDGDFYDIMDRFMSVPFQPAGIKSFTANVSFHTIKAGDIIAVSDDVVARTFEISHPNGALAFRVEYGGKVLCYCTDIELADHKGDADLLDFTRNADLLILDSFFDDDVMAGWGHSSWRECAEWSKLCGAKKTALFHYKYTLSDEDIDVMEEKARAIFPGTFAAADMMRVEL